MFGQEKLEEVDLVDGEKSIAKQMDFFLIDAFNPDSYLTMQWQF